MSNLLSEPTRADRPDEAISPDQQFRTHLTSGRFCMQRSSSTGEFVWYPRVAAPGSGALDLTWTELSGCGRVYSTTVVREKPPAPSYNVALIDLQEGVRIMSRVEGIAPENVRIGMKVRARIVTVDSEPLVIFEPDERDGAPV